MNFLTTKVATVSSSGGLPQLIDRTIQKVFGDNFTQWLQSWGGKVTFAFSIVAFFALTVKTILEFSRNGVKEKKAWIYLGTAILVAIIAGASGIYTFFAPTDVSY